MTLSLGSGKSSLVLTISSQSLTHKINPNFGSSASLRYINEVDEKLRILSNLGGGNGSKNFKQRLAVWGLEIDAQPVQHKAKILKAPKIKFLDSPMSTSNGSFNLNRVKFSR